VEEVKMCLKTCSFKEFDLPEKEEEKGIMV
jgi:hypothetical protein